MEMVLLYQSLVLALVPIRDISRSTNQTISVPCTALSALIIILKLHVHSPKTNFWDGIKRIDWIGSGVMITGAILLLLGVQMGGVEHPWTSPIILSFIIIGGILACLFVYVEWKIAAYPIMPLRVLSNRTSISALGVCCFHSMCLVGGAYFLPLYMQGVLGASALMSGVYLLPLTLSLCFSNVAGGLIVRKTGKYLLVMRGGACLMVLGFGLFVKLPANYQWAKIIIFQIIAGIGIGPNFQCPLLAVQASSPQADHAVAASTFNFANNLSASIIIVVSTTIFQNSMQKQHSTLVSQLGPEVAELLTGQNAAASVEAISALPGGVREIAQKAFLKGMFGMWILYIVCASLSVLCSLCVQNKVLSKEHKMTETGIEAEEAKRNLEEERKRAKRDQRNNES